MNNPPNELVWLLIITGFIAAGVVYDAIKSRKR
jgi:hypothetical protein